MMAKLSCFPRSGVTHLSFFDMLATWHCWRDRMRRPVRYHLLAYIKYYYNAVNLFLGQ